MIRARRSDQLSYEATGSGIWLFEPTNSSRCVVCPVFVLNNIWLRADTLNRDNLWYPSLVDMKMNISTTGNVNLNMSDDWDKTINKNLEQLIIPQASVPYKVMQRADSSVLKY